MTHDAETTYHDDVAAVLEAEYGERNVESQRYLDRTGKFPDFWVTTPLVDLAIEVENDWPAALYEGVGQAMFYAAHSPDAVPVVVVPPGHVEEPDATMIRTQLPVVLKEVEPL